MKYTIFSKNDKSNYNIVFIYEDKLTGINKSIQCSAALKDIKEAISKNIPRNWIVSEKELIEISKNFLIKNKIIFPKNYKSNCIEKDSMEIEKVISKFYNNSIYDTEKTKEFIHNPEYKKIANELYDYYKSISLKNKISYQILSPKKMIFSYLKNKDDDSRLIKGWRKELIDMKKINSITSNYF